MMAREFPPLARPTARLAPGIPSWPASQMYERVRGRDGLKNLPGPLLKIRTDGRNWDGEFEAFSGEILADLFSNGVEVTVFAGDDARAKTSAENRQFAFQRPAVGKLKQTQTRIIHDSNHRTQWGFETLDKQTRTHFCYARRLAEDADKCLAKSTGGFEAAVDLCLRNAAAFADFAQGKTHAPGTVVRLESHAIMTLELAPRCRRIDSQSCEFLLSDASPRSPLDLRAQTFD